MSDQQRLDASITGSVLKITESFVDHVNTDTLMDEFGCLLGALVPDWDDHRETTKLVQEAANYREAVRRLKVIRDLLGWDM